ncbi:MAG: ribonuclease HIII [Melioribacteraceae bacterium]|nr:ribonuclease HIII [Melioribacteraceae bacterium]
MNIKENAEKEIKRIIKVLNENKLNHSAIKEKQFNYEIELSLNKNSVKIQVYFGKKGVKTVIQGNDETKEYKIISNLISHTPQLNFSTDEIEEPDEYIGSDEAGKGDFFGPLVISAVYVNKEMKEELSNIGVKDSKKLSDEQIDKIAVEIKKICKNKFSIINLIPCEYNKLYEKYKNLNRLLSYAHSKAIEDLLVKTNCKYVITDKFSKKKLEIEEHKNHIDINFIKETKAEKYIGVAAASILARNEFNNWFEQMEKKNLNLPKGSSIITEQKAIEIVKNNSTKLNEICKLHFKTLNKAKTNY